MNASVTGSLQDRIQVLETPEQVDGFLAENPRAIIFKAGTCHQTPEAFAELERSLGSRTDLPVGVIPVVAARPASDRVTDRSGVLHQSPQLLIFQDGRVVFSKNRWEIQAATLTAALSSNP